MIQDFLGCEQIMWETAHFVTSDVQLIFFIRGKVKNQYKRKRLQGKWISFAEMILCSNTDCDSPPSPPFTPQACTSKDINIHTNQKHKSKYGRERLSWTQLPILLCAFTLYMCYACKPKKGLRLCFIIDLWVCLYAYRYCGTRTAKRVTES